MTGWLDKMDRGNLALSRMAASMCDNTDDALKCHRLPASAICTVCTSPIGVCRVTEQCGWRMEGMDERPHPQVIKGRAGSG